MNKIWLIVWREYLTRVRKKSFIVMSILGPVLLAAFYGVIIWATVSGEDQKTIQVVDESGIFQGKFENAGKHTFIYASQSLEQARAELNTSGFDAVLYIPPFALEDPKGFKLISPKGLSSMLENSIRRTIEKEIEVIRMQKAGIDKATLDKMKVSISFDTVVASASGENKESNTLASTMVGLVAGVITYFFIFMYGVQVMRGVIEEKTNRIVEVIISSVKPFQLMMGKILGIAGVGLTQLLIWVVLGIIASGAASVFIGKNAVEKAQSAAAQVQQQQMSQIPPEVQAATPVSTPEKVMKAINTINVPLMLGAFIFYFLFGYLTYAALFGSIGAAVDNETDTQQFMLPVTLPLVLAISLSSRIISDPDGPLAIFMSFFPLTSPVVMMMRLPFIGMSWELFVSMALLIGAFIGTTWLAGRIYRIGILMYGKKVTYKEIAKWLFYK